MSPLDPSQLIFPSAHGSITSTLTSLKRSNLSISNRLHAIKHDADFVQSVAEAYHLPLIANERCGGWYTPPSQKAGSAYFKSTDGHYGQWSFSLRRLNLQVLDVIERHGGCIIVDSTRRGKSMPDALSKTVPIWIAVLNCLLFPDHPAAHSLRSPEDVVSPSEHAQIEQRLPRFVMELRDLGLDTDSLRQKLRGHPLRVDWVTPDTDISALGANAATENLVLLCTASSRTSNRGADDPGYVQGAADDSESWAHGLNAAMFWTYSEQLLSTAEDDLPDVIESLLLVDQKAEKCIRQPVLVRPTKNIWISNNAGAEIVYPDFDFVISCSERRSHAIADKMKHCYLHLACTTGKVGSRQLRPELPKINHLGEQLMPTTQVLVTCQTGKDLSVGIALAIICLFCTDDGTFRPSECGKEATSRNKTLIKHRLSWIMVSMPDAAPSRATLQSVNAFLLR
ncbi:tRNA A64-2'-O-ribosylphosphate transferase [Vermiconidia calcicola]|uniref:tRNA A64-2'-O-ribosylphosphate transferase n=1 Tax=Vermiconidia calcicola TaxID=1690605 RepID=A0ACC3MDY3_9PEZI|nr:tRNA A64-2'-O-ribosylphosphate transferase [Vermiconidia calcicola]